MNTQIQISVKALVALGGLLSSAAVAAYAAVLLFRLYAAGGLTAETGQMLAGTMVVGSFFAILASMFLTFSSARPRKRKMPRRSMPGAQ